MDVGSVTWLVAVALLGLCDSFPLGSAPPRVFRKPPITYVAGPDQLTLLFDGAAFRFAYETDNQFRAERRFPNGTVAGFYGYIGADGKPVRVTYGAVDELGFTAVQEVIPEAFPETTDGNVELETTEPSLAPEESSEGSNHNKQTDKLFIEKQPTIDIDKDSISIDAADFVQDGYYRVDEPIPEMEFTPFVFPKIQLLDLPVKKRTTRQVSLPEARPFEEPLVVQRGAYRRKLILERHQEEPAIIYADPSRYIQTIQTSLSFVKPTP